MTIPSQSAASPAAYTPATARPIEAHDDAAGDAKAVIATLSRFDTTGSSFFHRVVRRRRSEPDEASFTARSIPLLYLGAIAATYLPLAAIGWATLPTLATRSAELRLPLLFDWNIMFMFLVTFPLMVVFTATDHRLLVSAVVHIARDRILVIAPEAAERLCAEWAGKFRNANVWAQWIGIVGGGIVTLANYRVYSQPALHHWATTHGSLNAAGVVYLYCICAFYFVFPMYALRTIVTSFFLAALVAQSDIRMVPFHPDRCGGLRPVGRLGLRNQYALTIGGLNVLLLVFVSLTYLDVPEGLYGLMAAATICYFTVGPLVFLGPLIPFRSGMLRTKHDLMRVVARRLKVELARVRAALEGGSVTKDDEELLDRLKKIGQLIDELPVWPFDAATLRKFASAYLLPVIASGGIALLKAIFDFAWARVQRGV